MFRIILTIFIAAFACSSKAQVQVPGRSEVLLETTAGNIRLQLYDETPLHRDNFLKLVTSHFYDSLLFHRVIKDFMIQCGDSTSRHAPAGTLLGEGDPGYRIPAEIRLPQLFHRRGVLAAAREPDDVNPKYESSASHFYIVWGRVFNDSTIARMQARLDTIYGAPVRLTPEMTETYKTIGGTPHLDGGYTVFGEVTEGMEVVDRIQQSPTDKNSRPLQDVRILRATITHKGQE